MAPPMGSAIVDSSSSVGRGGFAAESQPAEATLIHTRLLRCMLAADDCQAYWRRSDSDVPVSRRAQVAFECRWFGTKSEARVRTIMTDMVERFDAYPESIQLLRELGAITAQLRPLICHVHTQLADPIYRRFSGEFLPKCRGHGLLQIDRTQVADWVESVSGNRWSASTRLKFGANLLATAADAGIVAGKKDPRKLAQPVVPDLLIGYVLYLLRGTRIEGSLENNAYLLSLGLDSEAFSRLGTGIPGIEISEHAGVIEVTWLESGLLNWGRRYLAGVT